MNMRMNLLPRILPTIALFAGLFALTGCQGNTRLGSIQPGMSRPQVLDALGNPKYVATTEDAEYLWYDVKFKSYRYMPWFEPYYVKLTDGAVESYGKAEQYPVQPGQFVQYSDPVRFDESLPSDPSHGRMMIKADAQ